MMSEKDMAEAKSKAGKLAMEYAQQLAWLISLKNNEYITEDEYEEGCKRLRMKYHQTPRL